MSAVLALATCGCQGEDQSPYRAEQAVQRANDSGEEDGGEDVLDAAKLLIEHNAADGDTGFQVFADGEPWEDLRIHGPGQTNLIHMQAHGELRTLGLTELFFETNEPENDEVPIEELLALLPEGTYDFEARATEGGKMSGSALLTHLIPMAPVITSPAEGAVVDPNAFAITWESVTESITGTPVTIAAYQVIVEKNAPEHPQAFADLKFSAHVPSSVTSITVPKEFLEPQTAYEVEVLAIEESGNQTISSGEFMTQ